MKNVDKKDVAHAIEINKLLFKAVKENNISKETSEVLQKQYEHTPEKLEVLLEEFAKERVNYLMSLDYKELDKMNLLEELKRKYFNGFARKYFERFGRHLPGAEGVKDNTTTKQTIERLLQFALDNKDLTPDEVATYKQAIKNNPDTPLEYWTSRIEKDIQNVIDELMKRSWLDLQQNDLLKVLKQKYYDGYLIKYKERFGVDSIEKNFTN